MIAIRNNRMEDVPDDEVDYDIVDSSALMGDNENLIPGTNSLAPYRTFYGNRFWAQAVPVVGAEAPLVRNLDAGSGRSFDDLAGPKAGALHAPEDIEVVDAAGGRIRVRGAGGERDIHLYEDFPFNRLTGLTQTPVVKPGDKVPAGGLLARSNFTDDKGALAMGVNARVAVVPYKGWSMDDAIVVSDALARRMASEHLETHVMDRREGVKTGREHFRSLFPSAFEKARYGHLDDDGVAKVGSVLKPGDPLILSSRPRTFSTAVSSNLGRLSRVAREERKDTSLVWDGPEDGIVVGAHNGSKRVKVVVRSVRPLTDGDKLVMRGGQKDIVARILPEAKMPVGEDGKPMEVLLNPLSIPSRVNDQTPFELLMGKVAAKKGEPVTLPGFNKSGQEWHADVGRMLAEAGLKPEERLYDPDEGRYLDNPVMTGVVHLLKLHHMAAKKVSARGQAAYDTSWQQPARGGEEGSKRFSGLETHATLASGGVHTLREGTLIKGQANHDYFMALRSGRTPTPPGRPFAFHKFRAMLAGAGINTRDLGKGVIRLAPFTDRDLDERNPIDIDKAGVVDPATFEPVPGGLFDERISGGNRWGRIRLPHPVPNPAFESSIRRLLGGLTKQEFREILAGRRDLEI